MSKLQTALDHHQATLNQAFTAQDRAVNALLLLLIEEVQAVRSEMALLHHNETLPSTIQSPITALHPQALTVAPETIQALQGSIKDLGQEIKVLRREMESISQIAAPAVSPRPRSRIPTSNVAPMHPVEELLDEAATLDSLHDGSSNQAQLSAYINRQRVRPEDIQLTPEEIARTRKGLRRHSNTERELTPEQVKLLIALSVGVILITIVWCGLIN